MRVNGLEDKRQEWKIKHNLVDILVIVMLAILTGHNDFEEMVIFADARIEILRKYIKLENGIPHKDTLQRVVAIIDPIQLNLVFYSWLANIVNKKNHVFLYEINKIIAFDGKTICCSDNIYNKALHILTAFDTENELVLGQLSFDEKTNEITVMPELVKLLDLENSIVVADALNCQYEIANAIIEKNGNYVLADFWASWCRPCREETPYIIDAYNKFKEKGLVVIGIPINDKLENTLSTINNLKIPYPQIMDGGNTASEAYNVTHIPHIILFGPDGTIIKRGLRGEEIDQVLSEIYN